MARIGKCYGCKKEVRGWDRHSHERWGKKRIVLHSRDKCEGAKRVVKWRERNKKKYSKN